MNKILSILSGILLIFTIEKLDTFQPVLGSKVELPHGVIVGQTFIAQHDNLSMVKIADTYNSLYIGEELGVANKDALVFYLKEYDKKNPFEGEQLAAIPFSGENFGNHSILQFKFDPIINSSGKKYIFYIENLGRDLTTVEDPGTLSIGTSKKDTYKEGELIIRDSEANLKRLKEDISFWSFYSVSPLKFVTTTMSDFLNRFWQDKTFLAFYLVSIGILIYFIRRN